MVVPAPGLLSITTGWPSRGASFSPTARATMSTPPPGGNGTMKRIGRDGYCCDWAIPLAMRRSAAQSSLCIDLLCLEGLDQRHDVALGVRKLCRHRRGHASAHARRALVHQPLQEERGDADHDQRAPGEVVVAPAVE